MMQRTSATLRGHRGATQTGARGGGRGGIQKRRTGPARIDNDGDLVMDIAGEKRRSNKNRAGPSRPQEAGRGSGGPARGGNLAKHKVQQAILRGLGRNQANVLESRITSSGTSLQIYGLSSSRAASNSDGGLEALLGFLERKASGPDAKSNRAVKIKKSHMKGDTVIITASQDDIADIQRLDQYTFAGAVLSIRAYEPASPPRIKGEKEAPSTVETKDKLRAVLAGRYNAEMRLLDLSALGTDKGLKEMGVFDGTTTTSKIFPALMVVCDNLFKNREEKAEAVISVTLADNGLTGVTDVATLAQTFPDLKNLDLSRNNITEMKSLIAWRWKFKYLENLMLNGNPIEAQLPTEKDEILRRYPNLSILNGVQVRTSEEVALNNAALEAAKSPIPIAGPDFRDVAHVGENFVRQFLVLYDNDRITLLAKFYDSQTVYSMAVNMTAPRGEISAPVSPWGAYTKHSRNLLKITHLPVRLNRSHSGAQAVLSVWSSLPATRHPDLQTQPEKYIIECHPQPGLPDPSGQIHGGVDGLTITLHGEFEEANPTKPEEETRRSFSRTFVLGPGAAGGQPIRVISDMIVLRAWAPLAMPQIQQINPEQQQKEALTMQLVERTGMTVEYAVLCLTETGGDIEQAFVAFTRNKDKLPAEAFTGGVEL